MKNVDNWIDILEEDLKVTVDRKLVKQLYKVGHAFELPNKGFSLCIINSDLLGNKVCCDVMIYLIPKERNIRNFKKLINFIEDTAKKQGCDNIQLGSSTGYKMDKVGRLYKKMGYKECSFRKEI